MTRVRSEVVGGVPNVAARCERLSAFLFGAAVFADVDEAIAAVDGISEYFRTGPIRVLDALVGSGLVQSRREARERIRVGAVRLNGTLVTENCELSRGAVVVRCGKRDAAVVIVE